MAVQDITKRTFIALLITNYYGNEFIKIKLTITHSESLILKPYLQLLILRLSLLVNKKMSPRYIHMY